MGVPCFFSWAMMKRSHASFMPMGRQRGTSAQYTHWHLLGMGLQSLPGRKMVVYGSISLIPRRRLPIQKMRHSRKMVKHAGDKVVAAPKVVGDARTNATKASKETYRFP